MKNLLLITFLSIGILFTSCDKFERCSSPEVAGTYSGTIECDEMAAENITFEVIPGVSDNLIIIDGITTIIEDCDIFGSTVALGTGREIDGDIDGNTIHFVETIIVHGNVNFRCLWQGVKN